MKLLFSFDKYLRKVEYALAITAGVITLLLMTLITVDILMRNVLNKALPGTFELVSLSFVGIVFLAIPYIQSIKGHIEVDIFTKLLPKPIQKVLYLLSCFLCLIIIIIITRQTILEALSAFISKDYTMGLVHYPHWPSKLSIALGMLMLSIRLCLDTIFVFLKVDNQSEDSTPSAS